MYTEYDPKSNEKDNNNPVTTISYKRQKIT